MSIGIHRIGIRMESFKLDVGIMHARTTSLGTKSDSWTSSEQTRLYPASMMSSGIGQREGISRSSSILSQRLCQTSFSLPEAIICQIRTRISQPATASALTHLQSYRKHAYVTHPPPYPLLLRTRNLTLSSPFPGPSTGPATAAQ